ncbi:MAG: hypothetical protein JHC33_10230 [Ignisphaera sp.]|nr:hypothetical protein [Ignisphaera sp.]
MSTYLGFSAALISTGYTPQSLQDTFSGLLSGFGWQIIRKSVLATSVIGTITNPSNAMSIDSSTTSATSATLPIYLGANIAAGFTPVTMYLQSDNNNSMNTAPTTFTLDWSTDGSTWNTLQSFSGQINWNQAERRKYTISGAVSETYWRINVTAVQSGTSCYIGDWILEDASGNWLVGSAGSNFFDCIPPLGETIGNSNSREFIRWYFNNTGTTISLRAMQELLIPLPQAISYWSATAGAATCSITIGGQTTSFTGTTGNTSLQNTRGLYEACKVSANSNFSNKYWVWYANQAYGGNASPGAFMSIQQIPAMNETITGSAITAGQKTLSVWSVPLVQGCQFSGAPSITLDVYNGFVYYLSVSRRGITLAGKTYTTYYTPIHCVYMDNTTANTQVPVADLAAYGLPCTPIELFVGTDTGVVNCDTQAYATHCWAITFNSSSQSFSYGVDVYNSNNNITSIFSHHLIAAQMQDLTLSNIAGMSGGNTTLELAGEGYYAGGDSGNAFQIHRVGAAGASQPGTDTWVCLNTNYGYPYVRRAGPYCVNLDWFKFTGTSPANEQILVSSSIDYTTTVSITGIKTDSSIAVSNTSGFPYSGWIILEGEIIQYSSSTSTSFDGCTRGMYNTMAVAPIVGTTIYIGAWFIFISLGLIHTGYQIPA